MENLNGLEQVELDSVKAGLSRMFDGLMVFSQKRKETPRVLRRLLGHSVTVGYSLSQADAMKWILENYSNALIYGETIKTAGLELKSDRNGKKHITVHASLNGNGYNFISSTLNLDKKPQSEVNFRLAAETFPPTIDETESLDIDYARSLLELLTDVHRTLPVAYIPPSSN